MSDPVYRGVDPARRALLFGGAMACTSIGAVLATPRPETPLLGHDGLERVIPLEFGTWRFMTRSGLVLPPRDETEERTYDQVLTRTYDAGDGGPPVMLLIAYGGGQTGLFEIHRPEACYPAQGFSLSDRHDVPIQTGPGRSVMGTFWSAQSDARVEQLLYWTRIGQYFPRSWAAEHVAVVRSNIVRKLPDGVLVRMSVVSGDAAGAIPRLEQFATALVAGTGGIGRRVLLGTA